VKLQFFGFTVIVGITNRTPWILARLGSLDGRTADLDPLAVIVPGMPIIALAGLEIRVDTKLDGFESTSRAVLEPPSMVVFFFLGHHHCSFHYQFGNLTNMEIFSTAVSR
jgi:hypothetical protein